MGKKQVWLSINGEGQYVPDQFTYNYQSYDTEDDVIDLHFTFRKFDEFADFVTRLNQNRKGSKDPFLVLESSNTQLKNSFINKTLNIVVITRFEKD